MEILANQAKLMPNIRSQVLINKCMDKTFPERRKYLLETVRRIGDVKEEYPLLFTMEQVSFFSFYLLT